MVKPGYWGLIVVFALGALACGNTGTNQEPGTAGSAGTAGPENAGGAGDGGTAGGSAGTDAGAGTSSGGSGAGTAGTAGAAQGGTGGNGGSGGSALGGTGGGPVDPPQLTSTKLDLLFVVDNSISMAEKQSLMAATLPSFLRRLANPLCVAPDGSPSPGQPGAPELDCAAGFAREFSPVRDMHVGVITTSLGARGGQICTDPAQDDRAQLLPSMRSGLPSYDGRHFLKWDPDGLASPPGQGNINALAADLTTTIAAATATGCGYEHTLEAWYQFLIDPEPTTDIQVVGNLSTPMGVNTTVLEQRAAFLRPDSALAIVVLTDENDCSIRADGVGWLVGLTQNGGRAFTMPRSTAACAVDPNDACCRSCAAIEPDGPPAGCAPLTSDAQCQINGGYLDNSVGVNEDQLNLRCFDQKRRFGFDLLYPIERYTTGLTAPLVPNRQGQLVPNPLFSGSRNPSLVSFALIAGIPWPDISPNPPGDEPEYLSAVELQAQGRWPLILGHPAANVPPLDPLLWETPNPRAGTSPLINAPLAPASSQNPQQNPINGHEQLNLDNTDLQYSCIYRLPVPLPCADPNCDCGPGTEGRNRPLCQPPGGGPAGSTQYYGKAYPPLRSLALARSLGKQAVLGSICPRDAIDFAYGADFNSLARRLGVMLIE
jgi:hypothetical protein